MAGDMRGNSADVGADDISTDYLRSYLFLTAIGLMKCTAVEMPCYQSTFVEWLHRNSNAGVQNKVLLRVGTGRRTQTPTSMLMRCSCDSTGAK